VAAEPPGRVTASASTAPGLTLLRLGPGEDILAALLDHLTASGGAGAVVTAGIGSVEHARIAVAVQRPDGTVAYSDQIELDGPTEVASLQGHLGREDDGSPTLHLHAALARDDGSVVAGHVFALRVLVTFEIALLSSHTTGWGRSRQPQADGSDLPILLPEEIDRDR
jgi:predicted DNA-binding protein with PD1-like motif